ncbi:hypothetical protein L227DRAFT_493697 [Lentinus tigrinus ALCF2SS1-6]|uniref:F-box domain-containing protein n=1 Tax=Lentinus tigrinus ALCF2SS1-6 TaxID=1328759 RepID=A0A5C2SX04_9APHY|nr:hypothetical protein L227DRAFT_493697 [Lentinus tigrinus ALCF2SS1-6]
MTFTSSACLTALHIHLIHDELLGLCSVRTLLRLRRTCRAVHQAVDDYMRNVYNIDLFLDRLFPDSSRAFRSLQARTGTLIGGLSALRFLQRIAHPPTEPLELYIHACHRREVGRWLLRTGYIFSAAPHQTPEFEAEISNTINLPPDESVQILDGVAMILRFCRAVPETGMIREVKVIVAENNPMEVILSFYSTCLMNVISFNKAYCLFPRATLEMGQTLVTSSPSGLPRRYRQGTEQHLSSGHTLLHHIPHDELHVISPAAYPLGWRWVHDGCSWVLPLSIDGVESRARRTTLAHPLFEDPVTICNWQVRYSHSKGASVHFGVMRSEHLKYKYLSADPDLTSFIARSLAHTTSQFAQGEGGTRRA